MTIELWFTSIEDDAGHVVHNAPCIPRAHEIVELPFGARQVCRIKYDFHESSGNVRVHIAVQSTAHC